MKKEEDEFLKKNIQALKKAGIRGAKAAKNLQRNAKNLQKKQNKDYTKVCGKNCKWNKMRPEVKYCKVCLAAYLADIEKCKTCGNTEFKKTRRFYYCYFTMKRCGQNTTCNCFDDNGKFRFERKDTL